MSTATAARANESSHGEGIKDTIESIVVALILAFVFRAFVVEAFVIPTGSMAPTLYGAHGTISCEDCGTEFAYGLKDPSNARGGWLAGAQAKAICPNCRHRNSIHKTNDDRKNPESGDRILVLKWPNDIGGDLLGPARWDVTVFKNPANGVENYIKRMVGLPNEVLMILDGDVYTMPSEGLSAEAFEEFDRFRHEKHEHRVGIRTGRLRPISQRVLKELDQKLSIARKTATAQRALWFPVYRHDYPPRSLDVRSQPHWKAQLGESSGWETSSRCVRFTNRGRDADGIRLDGAGNRATYAYNIPRTNAAPSAPPVSDRRVRFVLTPRSAESIVRVGLEKLGRVFWATVRADGVVSIIESPTVPTSSTPAGLRTSLRPFVPGRSVEIGFENVDYRLALRVDGKEVLTSSPDPEGPLYYAPDVNALRKMRGHPAAVPPRISAAGGDLELAHLVVERDIYYYDAEAPREVASWGTKGWGTTGNPVLLRSGEYFMLGDNSAASQDSRLWGTVGPHLESRGEAYQLGTVPQDQLIGKAFFVYWPSGHRLEWLPILNRVGLIPDVGRMRWIR